MGSTRPTTGGASLLDNLDPDAMPGWLFDASQLKTQECKRVQSALGDTFENDVGKATCAPLFAALNISEVGDVVSSLKSGLNPADNPEDVPGMGGFIAAFQDPDRLRAVCSSPCLPVLYAEAQRTVSICVDASVAPLADIICAATNKDGVFCLSYADEIAQMAQDIMDASDDSILGAASVIGKNCELVKKMGCCFQTFLDAYGIVRTKADDFMATSDDKAGISEETRAQLNTANDILQKLSPTNIALGVRTMCAVRHPEPACTLPLAVVDAVAAATAKFAQHHSIIAGSKEEYEVDEYKQQRAFGHYESGVILACGLIFIAVALGIGIWWYQRKQRVLQMNDGAMIIQSDQVMPFESPHSKSEYHRAPVDVERSDESKSMAGRVSSAPLQAISSHEL